VKRTFALLVLLLLSLSATARAEQPPHPSAAAIGVDEHLGQRVPLDLPFRDSSGRELRIRDTLLSGRPMLMVLAYSRCPMVCSLVLRGIADVVRAMPLRPGEDYSLVTVSIDPSESSDMAARKQATLLAAADLTETRRWRFLVGEQPAIGSLAGALGFRYARDPASGEFAHPAVMFVLSPDGSISRYFYGLRHDPAQLAAALEAARRGATARSGGALEAVLSCFRFDPANRKYGGVITRALQVTTLAVLAALTIAIVALLRRRRAT
jgi:protein SCO1/2